MIIKIFSILCVLITFFSCNKYEKAEYNKEELKAQIKKLKKEDSLQIKEGKTFKKIDSLSNYKISEMKRFIDSLKVSDSVKYFALRKVIESDSLNYYNNYEVISIWNVTKMSSDSEYLGSAKKILLEKNKK